MLNISIGFVLDVFRSDLMFMNKSSINTTQLNMNLGFITYFYAINRD